MLPLVISAASTFGAGHWQRGLVWDSAHYLLSAQSLLQWLANCLSGHFVSLRGLELGPSLLVDGPVLPAFGALAILIGKPLGAPAGLAILAAQSILVGLNSLLLYLLARRLGGGRKLSCCAALALGLDPATIVSAGQFLTELLTAATLLAFTLTMTLAMPRGKLNSGDNPSFFQYGAYVFLGALALFVLHLKTALFPTVVIICAGLLVVRKNSLRVRANIVIAMIMGFFFTLVPWLAFSKMASGRMSLGPNRVPSINLAVGMDLESDGWGVAPPTESVMAVIFDKPSAIVTSLWQGNELEMSALFARKLGRLFCLSWNDFNWSVFGLDWQWQNALQRCLLCTALLGTIYLLVQEKLLHNKFTNLTNVDLLKLTILLMVAGHLIFVPFEAQPRYGYSAVPFLILLSLIGAQKLRKAQIFPHLYAATIFIVVILGFTDLTGTIYNVTNSSAIASFVQLFIGALLFADLINIGTDLALGTTFSADKKRKLAVVSGSLVAAMIFLSLASYKSPPREWSCTLDAGRSAERRIEIPENLALAWQKNLSKPGSFAALLIDADQALEDAQISVNGRDLITKPVPILSIEQSYAFQNTIKDLSQMAAQTRGDKESDLRQWRLVPNTGKRTQFIEGRQKYPCRDGRQPPRHGLGTIS